MIATLLFLTFFQARAADLSSLIKDDQKLAEDSEISISFPAEVGPSFHTILLRAKASHFTAETRYRKRPSKTAEFNTDEYKEIVEKLRRLKESDFETSTVERCIEPYVLRITVGASAAAYHGCRGSGSNSEIISKIAWELEFLMVKHSSK